MNKFLSRSTVSALLLFAALVTTSPSTAQDVQRIAAVVNEEVISIYDLRQRMRILIASSGLPNNQETQRRISPQVMRSLVDEALQKQEAARLNIRVTDRDMEEAVARVEQSNNIPAGGFEPFLQRQGISPQAALEQIRTNISWQKLLSRAVIPTIEIGEDKIDDVIKRIEDNHGVTEFRVSEILLPVDNPSDTADIQSLAERLVQQIRSGTDFRAVAQQFSKSATAAIGGDIGWILQGELEKSLDTAISALKVGEISNPIETADGITIVRLSDQRTNAPPDEGERIVKLRQILLLVGEDAPQSDADAQMQKAQEISSAVNGCPAFATAAEEAGTPQPDNPAQFKLSDLNTQLREIASTIEVGKASEPLRQPAGVQILMVCEREDNAGLNRDEIRRTLLRERVGMLSRRYLRDLRRAAFVDLRV